MKPFEIRFTKEAKKDIAKLPPKLRAKLLEILQNSISKDPAVGKKLVGDLEGYYSVRLTFQDRIVYSINAEKQSVTIHRARTHYGD